MAEITLKGTLIHTVGELPAIGSTAPDFRLTSGELKDLGLSDFEGKRKVLNIVSSLDTSVCAVSARTFNERIGSMDNVVVLTVSADLPFAQSRFCETEGLDHVIALSCFRSPSFGSDYGVTVADGPTAGLLSRAILVLDETNRIIHAEQVPEIVQEPDYDAALQALN